MKLSGHPFSTCTRKVLTLLHEKGQKPELNVVDFAKGEHKTADYMGLQPFGKLPVLEDDGFVLYESRAICRYLDEKLGGTRLAGTDLKSRAVVEQWISVEQSEFSTHAMKVIMQAYFHPMFGQPTDQEVVAAGRKGLEIAFPILDRQLARHTHLAGDAFTLADLTYMPYVEYLTATPVKDLFDKHTHVAAWWKRISDRPSWKAVTGKA